MMQVLVDRAVAFSYDRYANFVIQYLLRHGPLDVVDTLINHLIPHVVELSCHKYSSKVVEACLIICNAAAKKRITDLILGEIHSDVWVALICDPYAEFIVRRIAKSCSDMERHRIRVTALRVMDSIIHDTTQKNLIERVERLANVAQTQDNI